jgi:hypothetical protein
MTPNVLNYLESYKSGEQNSKRSKKRNRTLNGFSLSDDKMHQNSITLLCDDKRLRTKWICKDFHGTGSG